MKIGWVLVAMALLAGPTMADAVVSIVDSSDDLDVTGDFVYAINTVDDAGATRTWGGLTFTQTATGYSADWIHEKKTGNAMVTTLLTGDEQRILGNFGANEWNNGPINYGLTVEVGQQYKLQMTIGDTWGNYNEPSSTIDITVEGTEIVSDLNFQQTLAAAGTDMSEAGLLITYEFTAGDDTLNIVMADPENGTFGYGLSSITLETSPLPTYDQWATDNGIDGEPADDDTDGGGLSNGIEMVVGGLPADGGDDVALMPTGSLVTDPAGVPAGDYIEYVYRRTDLSVASGVTSVVQYGTDLQDWTTAVGGVGGVVILEDNDFYPDYQGSGVDRVRVYIPRGANLKLFAGLQVAVP